VSRLLAIAFVATLTSAGCASQLSIVKAENKRLRAQVTDLRADKRRAERKTRELENELALLDERDDTRAIGKARTGRPVLPVEVMAPSADDLPPSNDVDLGAGVDGLEPGQRVVDISADGTAIIYEGAAATGRAATFDDDTFASDDYGDGSDDRGADDPEPPPPPRTKPRAKPAAQDRAPTRVAAKDERAGGPAAEAYRTAVDLLRAGNHDDAIAQLRDFVKRYPDHDYADNAQYWLGEAFYDRKDYAKALAEFRAAVDKFPRGNKVPDALLKVGYCYLALGQTDKGRFALEQVTTIYPKTEPAGLAAKRLETIGP
jgi:tol-pal system protein YbgF